MSATLTSSQEFSHVGYRLWKHFLKAAFTGLLCVLLIGTAAHAKDHDGGFFDFLPAAPDVSLPKIDIPFWTDDLKVGRRAYNRGNYARAMKYFQKSSEDSNMVADWYLGHMYRLGQGVPVDDTIAYSYYSRVSEQFDPEEPDLKRLRVGVDAQLRVARYISDGIPQAAIKASPDRAAKMYLRLASNYGHPEAMYALGAMNVEGHGIKKNPQQGLKWLMAGARKRNADALAYLGELYVKGEVVRKDDTRALMFYILANTNMSEENKFTIKARSDELLESASDDMRLEAEARAKVWAEQYPIASE